MSDTTQNLSLPLILPSQAQKHVTHNEALRLLDILAQLSVLSRDLPAPPATVQDGDRYIVASAASGEWAGQTGNVAVLENATWQFVTPKEGWVALISDLGELARFDGVSWLAMSVEAPDSFAALGIGTAADPANPLSVASDATLLSHDGAGQQLKINKAGTSDFASIVFQTDWSGRAEIGTLGSDDFQFKVSSDGSNFLSAMTINHSTGLVSFDQGVSGLTPPAFGDSPVVTSAYVASRGVDLVTNGTGFLGNSYNFPSEFVFDPADSPNLPGSVSFAGHYPGLVNMDEYLAVDPNRLYQLTTYIKQETLAADLSAYTHGDRHQQTMGFETLDIDGNQIQAVHHARFRLNGVDSLTTLTAPLKPGDTTVSVADLSGWNEASTYNAYRGIIVFGYKNSFGQAYDRYSRIYKTGLFDLNGVDKANNTLTLNQPLPASMGNPDDPNGEWPVGTRLANTASGSTRKYCFFEKLTLPTSGDWYQARNYIGGIDGSGRNVVENFSPGTAYLKICWLPNFSNRSGGYGAYPDTGANHRVWFAGVSVTPFDSGSLTAASDPDYSGSLVPKIPTPEASTGVLSLQPAALNVTLL